MLRAVEEHLESNQVSRVIYGAIIGLALVVALEHNPPDAGVMIGTLTATGVAVGLAELFSEIVGTEVRTHRRVSRSHFGEIAADVGAAAFGVSFPAVFFVLSAAGVMDVDTAFDLAKWTGLGLTGFYGFWAARLAGAGLLRASVHAAGVALICAFLIALKALVH
jgi:hypothetical protein